MGGGHRDVIPVPVVDISWDYPSGTWFDKSCCGRAPPTAAERKKGCATQCASIPYCRHPFPNQQAPPHPEGYVEG